MDPKEIMARGMSRHHILSIAEAEGRQLADEFVANAVDASWDIYLPKAEVVLAALNAAGGYVVFPDQIGWPEIERYHAELARGQSVYEDGGGFFARCIRALLRTPLPEDAEVLPYREAAKALLQAAKESR